MLEPRTALAYERSELVADETAARVAALAAWRSGAGAGPRGERPGAPPAHDRRRPTCPPQPRRLKPGDRLVLDRFLLELLGLGYQPVIEVAGRGEFARRGGIVDVFPPGSSLPVRIELFGDEIDSLRSFDPTDQRTTERIALDRPAAGHRVPRSRPAASTRSGPASGGRRPGCPSAWPADLARFEGARSAGRGGPAATRPRLAAARVHVGDAAEIWAGIVCPATGLDHVAAARP